jgi:large subunit ribosomal protein L28
MARECFFTGARTSFGNKIRTRGRAKYLGGVGTKITACTRRSFKPNLQSVTALIDGVPMRIKASTKAIKMGLVVKPAKRKHLRAHGAL